MTNRHSAQSPLRVGLIGCGRVAQRVHAPILGSMPGVELAGVTDPSADAKTVARRCNPEARLFDDAEALLADDTIEAVVIASPTGMHAQAAEAALASGKHVYLEKPIAANARDAERVLRAHSETGLIGFTGFNYRYHPLHRRLRELVHSGAIGTPRLIRTVFTTPARDLPVWKRSVGTGGGVLLDLFSHHADLVACLTGEPIVSVSAITRSVYSEGDNAAVSMTLASGLCVQSTVSMVGSEQDQFEVMGDDGCLTLDRFRNSLVHTPGRHFATTPELVARAFSRASQSFRALRPVMDPSYRPALQAFVDAVRHEKMADLDPGLDAGWQSLAAVLAAAASSASQGVATAIPESPADAAQMSVDSNDIEINTQPEVTPLPADDGDGPLLSVVLVTLDGMHTLAKVLGLLRRQTIASRLQILIVAPGEGTLRELDSGATSDFFGVTPVYVGKITDIDMSSAAAVPHATARYTAFLEDHAFPQPDWAERIVETFREFGAAGVGTAIENGNPASVLSWANMLMSYGQWVAAEHRGPTAHVSRHNVAFQTEVLRQEYGDDLPRMMGRDGGLLNDLIARGHGYAIDPGTHVRHVNPSTWASTIELRVGSGRMFASSRMKRERWSTPKRLLYIAGAPAIPCIRFRLLTRDLIGPGSEARRERIGTRAYPAIVIGVVLDGIGQLLGHAFGPGRVKEKLAFFEIGRERHLRASDRHIMTDPES